MAHEIALTVTDHKVEIATGHATVVDGCVEHYTVTATFDSEWDGLTKYVSFSNSAVGEPVGPLAYADNMDVPWEALAKAGILRFAFKGVGSDGKETALTKHMRYGLDVAPSGEIQGADAQAATVDVTAQCVEATEGAESVNATLSGTTLTVTDRTGASTSVNTQGETGSAATVTVGTTTTGAAGTDASVTNSGTTGAAVLDFVIPRGAKGDQGDKGATGDPFKFSYIVASVIDMYAQSGMEDGDFCLINTGNVEDPANSRFYCWNEYEQDWLFVNDLSGAAGIRGDAGYRGDSYSDLTLSGTSMTATKTHVDASGTTTTTEQVGDIADALAGAVVTEIATQYVVVDALPETLTAGLVYMVRE